MATFIGKIIKHGSDGAVIIPGEIIKQLGIQMGDEVEVIIKPLLKN